MFSDKIVQNLIRASFIRSMFEEGEKLKAKVGAENVFDFSLGNPVIEPPRSVKETLKRLASEEETGMFRYMSNAGYWQARKAVADSLSKESKKDIPPSHVIITCGAGGALNVLFKSLLNPGEEVIVFSPYFVEYGFYVDNHGGKLTVCDTIHDTFMPDLAKLEKLINEKTKVVMYNSPNNPTGVIYKEDMLKGMNDVITAAKKKYGTQIFVIADEPYVKIVYDGKKVPSVFNFFKNAISVNSFSKSLAVPGERIGYIAVSPEIDNADLLMDALIFCNRTLGYVNAPAVGQHIVIDCINESIDVEYYKKRRDLLYNALVDLGFKCIKPEGAFYLFPESPIPDDVAFTKLALKYNLIIVPGSGFGCGGYLRLTYCVDYEMIERSLPAFEKLAKEVF
jgi:aspartate aminotransferase